MATHSSVLAWEIPWTDEPGGLQSMALQRVRHDLATENKQMLNSIAILFLKNLSKTLIGLQGKIPCKIFYKSRKLDLAVFQDIFFCLSWFLVAWFQAEGPYQALGLHGPKDTFYQKAKTASQARDGPGSP